jgi:hypothetical protein
MNQKKRKKQMKTEESQGGLISYKKKLAMFAGALLLLSNMASKLYYMVHGEVIHQLFTAPCYFSLAVFAWLLADIYNAWLCETFMYLVSAFFASMFFFYAYYWIFLNQNATDVKLSAMIALVIILIYAIIKHFKHREHNRRR